MPGASNLVNLHMANDQQGACLSILCLYDVSCCHYRALADWAGLSMKWFTTDTVCVQTTAGQLSAG